MLKHQERNDRVVEIKVEIAGLMRRKVNLAHPASAFRCNRERWERFYTQPPNMIPSHLQDQIARVEATNQDLGFG